MTPQIDSDLAALQKLASRSDDEWQALRDDEPTPVDSEARHRATMRKLDAVISAQAVIARVLVRHDGIVSRVGRVWDVLERVATSKITWLVGGAFAARPGLVPDWMWELVKAIGQALADGSG